MDIYLDFDGTVVEHFYPEMGEYNKGAVEVIKKLKNAGHKVILNTARVEFENGTFEKAIDYLNKISGEEFFNFQNSAKSKISPCNWDWNLFLLTTQSILMILVRGYH
ncbi:MAG: HAD hydrolase family protein [Bacteroidetes bacterium]|nr:HAD hydrolase family protein [Bacteroidota bacterium]